jgi:hypothetical protein
MLESILVGLIVLVAALYAAWALMPPLTRRNVALRICALLGGPTAPGLTGRIAARLQKAADAKAGGCGDCPAATLTPAERAEKQAPDGR